MSKSKGPAKGSKSKGSAKNASRKKKVSNPFSTGGGGVHFESEVQAAFVGLLLTGGYAPCFRQHWPIVEIKLQGKVDGYDTDDIIVFMESPSNKERRKLLCQVKHSIAITKGSKLLGEVMKAAWDDYRNPSVFNKGVDAIALITGPISETDHHNVSWMLHQARYTKDVNQFLFNIQQTNFAPSKVTEKLDALKHHLKAANDGTALSDVEVYDFLNHFHVLGYDLDNNQGVISSLFQSHFSQFQLASPGQTWAEIVREVQAWNRNAGTITRDRFPKDIVDAFKPKVVTVISPNLAHAHVKPVASIVQTDDATFVSKCLLLGSWNEKMEADRDAVAGFLGMPYEQCVAKAREVLHVANSPLSVKDGIWLVDQRPELLESLGGRLLDQDLDAFSDLSVEVLGEFDPTFELAPEERYRASIYGKSLSRSSELRRGVAQGLALLANNSGSCSNCTHGKPGLTALKVVRELLSEADWTRWGSLNRLLPSLAEAAPNEFLNTVEAAIQRSPCPFDELSAQETGGITGRKYLTGCLWALENLAWDENMLVRVCVILAELSNKGPDDESRNGPFDSLVTILLPWFPQTLAPFEKHVVAVRTVIRDFPDLAWRLIIQLLPGQHSSSMGSHKPQWLKLIPDDWEARPKQDEYNARTLAYSELAIEAASNAPLKLSVLVQHLQAMPQQAFDRLLDVLRSDGLRGLPDSERQSVWEALIQFIAEHRRFADAEWAFSEDVLKLLGQAASQLAPTDPLYLHRAIFSSRDLDLYNENDDWDELQRTLAVRRDDAVKEIWQSRGLECVYEFADSVEHPQRVGLSLGAIDDSGIENALLPALLASSPGSRARLLAGFVWRRIEIYGWEWCDRIDKATWSESQIVEFLLVLPFKNEAWECAKTWLEDRESEYWIRTPANPYETQEDLSFAIEKLLECDRPYSAIRCIERQRHDKRAVNLDQCTRALLAAISTNEPERKRDPIQIAQLIQFLQSEASVSNEALAKIEWAYIPFLDGHFGVSPKLLDAKLADDPEFFCTVIQLIFKTKNENQERPEPTDQDRAVAIHAWRLLQEWKTVPGVRQDQILDAAKLTAWLTRVKERCTETGHLDIAMQQVGEVLIHAPADPSGLWIDQAVAAVLNDKESDQIRRGFFIGTLNSRGAHYVDPTGKPERELAEANRKKAGDVENLGFQRLAVTLRQIADWYDREAEKIIHEHATEEEGGE